MLFDDELNKNRIEDIISLLEGLGYIVIRPSALDVSSVKNSTTLVDYFYSLLQFKHPDRVLHYVKSRRKDLQIASNFIKSRKMEGVSTSRAINECAVIVKCVIDNEDSFCFDEPLHSMYCFGQDTMKWVTDKAISIINRENGYHESVERSIFWSGLENTQEKEALDNIEQNIDRLKNLLKVVEDVKK